MKVTLTYQVDFEEVPVSISQLIKNLADNDYAMLGPQLLEIRNALGRQEFTLAIQTLDSLRQQLAKMDQRLLDYSSILEGYLKADAALKSGVSPDELFAPPSAHTQEVSPENILDEKKEDD